MKLCAIYNVWDDWDLLYHSIDNISPHVDGIIVVYSTISNFGEVCEPPMNFSGAISLNFDPDLNLQPAHNERNKRNLGLEKCKELGYTHYIMMDADEFYEPIKIRQAKEYMNANPRVKGLVVECITYFAHPELSIGKDITLVPFIHEITPTLKHEFNRNYPFAWINGQIRIDPTRSLNINSGVEMFDCPMHHYSWIRKDFKKKIRNSTARTNLERSTILKDLMHAKEGYFCEFYQKHLIRVSNRFGIPDYGVLEQNLLESGGPLASGDKAN